MLGPARPPTGQCLCSPAHSFSPPPRVCPVVVASELYLHSWSPEQDRGQGLCGGIGCRACGLSPHFYPFHFTLTPNDMILSVYQNSVCVHVLIVAVDPTLILDACFNQVSCKHLKPPMECTIFPEIPQKLAPIFFGPVYSNSKLHSCIHGCDSNTRGISQYLNIAMKDYFLFISGFTFYMLSKRNIEQPLFTVNKCE